MPCRRAKQWLLNSFKTFSVLRRKTANSNPSRNKLSRSCEFHPSLVQFVLSLSVTRRNVPRSIGIIPQVYLIYGLSPGCGVASDVSPD